MEKIKYTRHEDYEDIKEIFLEKVKSMKGEIPKNFDNDIFLSAFMKIYFYLTEKYKDVKIQPNQIPDVEKFQQREQYTVSQFLFNRIINNLETIEISNEASEGNACGGFYNANQKKLKIFQATILNATGEEFEKYKNLNFESQEDFNKIVTEYFIIHELIHAISFDELFNVGFKSSDKEVSINEGFTDSLALEISGFGEYFQYLPRRVEGEKYCIVPKNSISSYTAETNIADLIRVAAKQDLTLPYLINPYRTKWEQLGKLDASCYPVKENQEVYNYIAEEINVITTITTVYTNEEKITRFQNLQGCLIEDVLKNKYNEKFVNDVKNRNITYEQALQYDKDIATIINKLVLTLPEETAKQIYLYGARSLGYGDLKKIKELVKTGKIENTKNIQQYIKLMEIRKVLFEEVNQKNQNEDLLT